MSSVGFFFTIKYINRIKISCTVLQLLQSLLPWNILGGVQERLCCWWWSSGFVLVAGVLYMICRGSISTHVFGPLITLGRNIKVTILTYNNFVGWQCKWWVIVSRTTAQTRTHTFSNNQIMETVPFCGHAMWYSSAFTSAISTSGTGWSVMWTASFATSDDFVPCLRSQYWSMKEAAHGQHDRVFN